MNSITNERPTVERNDFINSNHATKMNVTTSLTVTMQLKST